MKKKRGAVARWRQLWLSDNLNKVETSEKEQEEDRTIIQDL
jgi:hypothetical protein